MNFLQTFKAVFWSFLGVRKGRDHENDWQNLKPIPVIIAGLVAALGFILILMFIVRLVVAG